MDWEIAPNMRCDLVGYTKPGYAGTRHIVQIFPSGRQGDLPEQLGSLAFVAPIGSRIVLVTSPATDWTGGPWRAITIVKGKAFRTKDGRPGVRVPDIDLLDAPDAHRTDPDFEQTFDFAESLQAGTSWTFGRAGPLKDRVLRILVDRVD